MDLLTHKHLHTPLTPYRAELMQEEMKYHYLRGKHTSVHTHTNHSLTHAHTYTSTYTTFVFFPSKKFYSIPLRNIVPTSKTIFAYFHTNHTLLFPMAFVLVHVFLLRLCAGGACLSVCIHEVVYNLRFVTVCMCLSVSVLVSYGVWV